MQANQETIRSMIDQIMEIRALAQKVEQRFGLELENAHPHWKKSFRNLLQYLSLRQHDILQLQKQLGQMALSRFGKAESHVEASILAILKNLNLHLEEPLAMMAQEPEIGFLEGSERLNQHAQDLFGKGRGTRRARIMVTFPSEAGEDYELVKNLLLSGMECARINCAHDGPEVWGRMVQHLHRAEKETGLSCKICMDLAGPKLRTGDIVPGPPVIHLSPPRDDFGRVVGTYRVYLLPEGANVPEEADASIPFSPDFLDQSQVGDEIRFKDTRDKPRRLRVLEVEGGGRWAESDDNTYLISETPVFLHRGDEIIAEGKIGALAAKEQKLFLQNGDTLILTQEEILGEPHQYDADGNISAWAHVSCALPSLYSDLRPGEKVLFDDGKIETRVKTVSDSEIHLEVTQAGIEGSKLKAEKGINLPESNLRLSGLTDKDREDLKFVVSHAHVANMSFVNSAQDVEDLLKELKALGAPEGFGIILKIETQRGSANLPSILMTAMQHYPIGVMIARGDLAVECGWQHLAEVQEEILRICEAAHVPNVWATQVLETLAKKGRPSRAEITDAAMSQRAECVMLNKGPYILQAIQMLDDILRTMQGFQNKKAPMLPVLKLPEGFQV